MFVIAFTRYTRFVFVSGEMFCSSAHLFILVKGIIFFAIFAPITGAVVDRSEVDFVGRTPPAAPCFTTFGLFAQFLIYF